VYPVIVIERHLQQWVLAWAEDREQLGEWAQEGRVGLEEELAKVNSVFLFLPHLLPLQAPLECQIPIGRLLPVLNMLRVVSQYSKGVGGLQGLITRKGS
jgi:hypothetical protein